MWANILLIVVIAGGFGLLAYVVTGLMGGYRG